MELTEEEKLIIDALIKLEKQIYNTVCCYTFGYAAGLSFSRYKGLVKEEKKLLDRLTIDKEKYDKVFKYINFRKNDESTSLLMTAGLYYNYSTYPHVRLISKLHYKLLTSYKINMDVSIIPLLIDEQVILLYNILGRVYEKYKNSSVAGIIKLLQIFTLADSSIAESLFLENPKNELEVYDIVRVATDIIVIRREDVYRKAYPGSLLTYRKEDPYIGSYLNIFRGYYKWTPRVLQNSIIDVMSNDDRYYDNLEYIYYVAYYKSLLAMLPKDIRLQKYKEFYEEVSKRNNNEDILRLDAIVDDIENNIVPTIIHARMNPYENPPLIHK